MDRRSEFLGWDLVVFFHKFFSLRSLRTKMTVANKPTLHVLRGILRRLKTKTDSSAPRRQYVLEQYRLHQSTDEKEAESLRKLAYDYSVLLGDLKERARLYELDAGAEKKLSPKEMSRRAAARAGLQLPVLNPDLE
jgi:hypothetical protein